MQTERKPSRNTEKEDEIACGFVICHAEYKLKLAKIGDFSYNR